MAFKSTLVHRLSYRDYLIPWYSLNTLKQYGNSNGSGN